MATKKSSKSSKTKTIKTTDDPFHKTIINAVVIAIAIILTASVIAVGAFLVASAKIRQERELNCQTTSQTEPAAQE